jgi:formylglycine-generating enzyme required for sulfatase activity
MRKNFPNLAFCLSFLASACFAVSASASDLTISNLELIHNRDTSKDLRVKLDLRWRHAWRNEKNHDAAWIVVKFLQGDNGYRHALLAERGHIVLRNNLNDASQPAIKVANDRVGCFIYPSAPHRGPVDWTIQVALDTALLAQRGFSIYNARVAVYGVEMVYIPAGAFTLGDPDTTALRFGAFYRADGAGKFAGLFKITAEKIAIDIGKEKDALYYRADEGYEGDQSGPLPPEFPKGHQAFYVMKYELTQGEYAAFLNALSGEQSQLRANFGGKGYYQKRGAIRMENGVYVAASPKRPCNFLSWDDACAFVDWIGLRPMTELEFAKACRGPGAPLAHEYPWGSSSKDQLARVIDEHDELVMSNGMNEGELTDKNREVFGASYFWVMDLAGSLWERVITVGHPLGRAFVGSHGDGRLNYYGFANNADWPKGDTEIGGFGFRGGGFYEHRQAYSEFNPHSPIAYRRFGAWAGGNRTQAYGSRFVRTAE